MDVFDFNMLVIKRFEEFKFTSLHRVELKHGAIGSKLTFMMNEK